VFALTTAGVLEAEMARRDDVPREVLPIPDRKPVGLTTYDAKMTVARNSFSTAIVYGASRRGRIDDRTFS
jgi:hypothetical protein